MTVQKLHLDLIDFRQGKITIDDLRRLFPTWKVSRDYARACVEYAKLAPIHKRQTGDLFA